MQTPGEVSISNSSTVRKLEMGRKQSAATTEHSPAFATSDIHAPSGPVHGLDPAIGEKRKRGRPKSTEGSTVKRHVVDQRLRNAIIALHKRGDSVKTISEVLELSRSTVQKTIKMHKDSQHAEPKELPEPVPITQVDDNILELRVNYVSQIMSSQNKGMPIVYIDVVGANTVCLNIGPRRKSCRSRSAGFTRIVNLTSATAMSSNGMLLVDIYQAGVSPERFQGFLGTLMSMTHRPTLFVLGNLPKELVGLATDMLQSKGHILAQLPPLSPELNPSEYVFHSWNCQIHKIQDMTDEEMPRKMREAWAAVPLEHIQACIQLVYDHVFPRAIAKAPLRFPITQSQHKVLCEILREAHRAYFITKEAVNELGTNPKRYVQPPALFSDQTQLYPDSDQTKKKRRRFSFDSDSDSDSDSDASSESRSSEHTTTNGASGASSAPTNNYVSVGASADASADPSMFEDIFDRAPDDPEFTTL